MTNEFFKHKGELFRAVTSGPWEAFEPLAVPEVTEPRFRWRWGPIPLKVVRQVTSFFEWSLKETGGETVVHLFYHEEDDAWAAVVLPQRGYTGMSVTLLPEHPGRVAAVEALGPGWEVASTWHHHGGISAFQSVTDKKDEEDVFGLHVTVGHVGTGRYSLDARCSFRKRFTPAALSDWVEWPSNFPALPDALADAVLTHLVCTPSPDTPFPGEWKANVIKEAAVTFGRERQPLWQPGALWQPEVPQQSGRRQVGAGVAARHDLRDLAWACKADHAEMAGWVKAYQKDELLMDLVETMSNHGLSVDDVLDFYEGQSGKESPDDEYDRMWKEAVARGDIKDEVGDDW